MKKFISLICMLVLTFSLSLTFFGCQNRNEILKIYNWGDYFDMDLLDEFEEWYEDEHGKKIDVKYDTFTACEDVYNAIKVQGTDYDLVCPSDYMVGRMFDENLLLEIDYSKIPRLPKSNIEPKLLESAEKLFGGSSNYGVPFHWGTTGIMQDLSQIPDKSVAKSWNSLFTDAYGKRIIMKNSVTDNYQVAAIKNNRADLLASANLSAANDADKYPAAFMTKLDALFGETGAETAKFNAVKTTLQNQRNYIIKYDSDEGKHDMANKATGAAKLGLFWSCDAGLAMYGDGNYFDHLYYDVPEEGSYLWLDYWLMPKTAKNTEAAHAFLNFINIYENRMRNLEYIGAAGPSIDANQDYKQMLEDDEEGIFIGKAAGFKQNYINALFPTELQLKRSTVRRSYGNKNQDVMVMGIDIISNI